MLGRTINTALLALALVGIWFTCQENVKQRPLVAEYRRLVEAVEEIPIKDPTKIHFAQQKSEEPWTWVTRLVVPSDMRIRWDWRGATGGTHTSQQSDRVPEDYLICVRPSAVDGLKVFAAHKNGWSYADLGMHKFAAALIEHPNYLIAETKPVGEVVMVEHDQIATLCRLIITDAAIADPNLQDELRRFAKSGT